MTEHVTRTDQGGSRWGINDEVIHLREWATQRRLVLPTPPTMATLGASSACTFHVDDPGVSREHLRLSYVEGRWLGIDRNSKNGTRIDGVRSQLFSLTPGCEIRTGDVTMLAESPRWIQLRQFLCRILGWADDQAETVDLALRSIRSAALGRGALYLSGDGDLAHVALSLHRFVWGADRPFVMADPRRIDGEATVRSVTNKSSGMEAFAAVHRGTLCVRAARPPHDLDDVLHQLERPGPRVLLVIVDAALGRRHLADAMLNQGIQIPRLDRRPAELPAIVDAYLADAVEATSFPRSLFTAEDREWVITHESSSLPEIEKATQRLLALRGSRNLSNAAQRLQMAPVSLSRWLGRRTVPASLAAKLRAAGDQ
jgi:hypothetical protein